MIRRGKAHKQTEFGRKVWLSEVDGGIVSGFSILEGNAGDESQLKPSLEDHLRLFEKPPESWWWRTATYTPKTTSGWHKGSV
ncbi:MAG: hypothetical protein M3317_14625 [Actinomycetota bacterium]|nr:hypothetical protein [Actinomycetota bacterium]